MANTAPTTLNLNNATIDEGLGDILVGVLSAFDADGDALIYTLPPGDPWFVILNGNELHIQAGLTLSYESHASLSTTVTVDDGNGGADSALFSITVTDLTAAYAINPDAPSHLEGHSGNTDFTFTVTRSGDSFGASTVDWAVSGSGGAPANAADFAGGPLPSGTVSFADGETSKTVTVQVRGDTSVEADESFSVTLSNGTGGTSSYGAAASASILNDDWSASIGAAAPLSQLEGDDPGTTDYSFTITRTGYLGAAADVSWSLAGSGGSPANSADFTATSGSVHFNAGAATGTITVSVVGDSHVEADEGFTVTIATSDTGGNIGTATSAATILNDDAGFSIDSPGITEGDSGTRLITFTISRAGYLGNLDAVHWTFLNDAYVPVDTTDFPSQLYAADLPDPPPTKDGYPIFAYLDGNSAALVLRDTDLISFAPGETSHTLTFEVNGDTWLEADDRFHILLQDPTPGSEIISGQGDGTGSIGNNDQPGSVGWKGTITGSGGNDSLTAPQQLNGYQFFGGPGDDTILGYGYDNLVYGAAGADSIYGGDGHSMVDGGAGDDRLRMHGYLDTVYGGTGDDSIFGTEGTALIDAGWGADSVSAAGNTNLILGNYGNDSIFGGDHDDTVYGGIGADTITTTDQRNLIYGDDDQIRRVGFAYNDSINGGDHDNTVFGGFADDTISFVGQRNVAHGEDDNDFITAGSGYDTVFGDAGNDTATMAGWGNFVDGGTGTDLVNEQGNRSVAGFKYVAGNWIIKVGYNIGSDTITNVESVHFLGGGADLDTSPTAVANGMVMQGDQVGGDSLLGLGGNDTLLAFGYNNTIDGGAGPDSIDGGRGNASITGGGGDDVIIVSGHTSFIQAGDGNDLVTLRNDSGSNHNNYVDLGNGNNTVSGGVDVNTIIGGNGTDQISVSGHNNLIQSGGGNDAITLGGGGQDTVEGGGGFDTVTFNFARFDTQIRANTDGSFDLHGPNGWDHLVDVERAVFTDGVDNMGRGDHGDVNGDKLGDLLLQNVNGEVWVAQNQFPGGFPTSLVAAPPARWVAKDSADLDADGNADIIFQDSITGEVWGWLMNGYAVGPNGHIGFTTTDWVLRFAADLDGDGKSDLIFRNSTTGDIYGWLQDGLTTTSAGGIGTPGTAWDLQGADDFDGDGRAELLFRYTDGTVYIWQMDGLSMLSQGGPGMIDLAWQVRGTGDFDGDGRSDVLWRNSNDGSLYVWEMNNTNIQGQGLVAAPGLGVDVAGIEDLTGDGRADIVLVTPGGDYSAIVMDGLNQIGGLALGSHGAGWHMV